MVPATSRIRRDTASAPVTANADTETPSRSSVTIAKTAAVLAPRLTPITSGLASALRSVVWKIAPLTPRAAPTMTASRARGSLVSIRMYVAPGMSAPKRIRKKSGTVIV